MNTANRFCFVIKVGWVQQCVLFLFCFLVFVVKVSVFINRREFYSFRENGHVRHFETLNNNSYFFFSMKLFSENADRQRNEARLMKFQNVIYFKLLNSLNFEIYFF